MKKSIKSQRSSASPEFSKWISFKEKQGHALLQSRLFMPGSNDIRPDILRPVIPDQWQDISFEINRPLAQTRDALLFAPLDTAGCVSIISIIVMNRSTEEIVYKVNQLHCSNLLACNEEILRVPSRESLDLFVTGPKGLVSLRFSDQLPDCPLQMTIRIMAAAGIKLHKDALSAHLALDDWETILQARGYEPDLEFNMRIAFAEMAMKHRDWAEAVLRWQDIISIKGSKTPLHIYKRLNTAYLEQESFPPGKPIEEKVSGSIDKHELLKTIHRKLQPEKYLEIGVHRGRSLALARCEAIGVDPMPMVDGELPEKSRIAAMTSDDYFSASACEDLNPGPDLAFIDGMHLFEYALRDFMNVERFATPWTLVVIDDIFPVHPAQAERRRKTRIWTGDVWKLYEILKTYRPDLFLLPVDSSPTGILLISALEPENRILWDNYEDIVKKYSCNICPPDNILSRRDARSIQDSSITTMLNVLINARNNSLTTESVADQLLSEALH